MDRIYDDFDDGTPRIMNNPLKITETNEKQERIRRQITWNKTKYSSKSSER